MGILSIIYEWLELEDVKRIISDKELMKGAIKDTNNEIADEVIVVRNRVTQAMDKIMNKED